MLSPYLYMQLERLGEHAWIARDLGPNVFAYAKTLRSKFRDLGVEVVPCFDTVGIYTPAGVELDGQALIAAFDQVEERQIVGRLLVVPVCFELGEDLAEVCATTQLSSPEFIQAFCSRSYFCFAIGFCPGFPYLGYLDSQLAVTNRKASPRSRIEPGSVAITGRQVGIYPIVRPGGWNLIGRAPLTLVDLQSEYFAIEAGDEVRFEPISLVEFERLKGVRL